MSENLTVIEDIAGMQPYKRMEIIGDCTLYLGNALDVLPTLPKSNLLLSDVPYKLTSGGNTKHSQTMKGAFDSDKYDNKGEIVACNLTFEDMAQPLFDALVDDADAYIMINDKNVFPAQKAFFDCDFKFHNLLTWNKGTVTPNKYYMKNQEYVLYLWKGKARTINNPSSRQEARIPHTDETDHPTEKPVLLMRHYIENSSFPGDIVLDPFMGAGTTGVAAVKTGRKFVGVEIVEKWFDVACERVFRAMSEPVQESFLEVSHVC